MISAWVVPLLAGIIGGFFAARVWGQWVASRRASQLAWAIGLTMYALASLIDAIVVESGWSIPLYRTFFFLAAANVGVLGLGTVLLADRWWGRAFSYVILALICVAAVGQLSIPLTLDTPVTIDGTTQPLAAWGTELGAKAVPFPNPGRVAFLTLNIVGGLALIGGALLSWWRTRQRGVLLIGVGAMLPFAGGSISTLFAFDIRAILQLLGIAVMFLGFLRAREAPRPVAPLVPDGGA